MQLTPIQRMIVVNIYFGLAPSRSRNRAETTSKLAAESKGIEISESGVKKIIKKWRATSNCFKILFALAYLVERSTLMRKYPSSIPVREKKILDFNLAIFKFFKTN
jgi:hypothetical protein